MKIASPCSAVCGVTTSIRNAQAIVYRATDVDAELAKRDARIAELERGRAKNLPGACEKFAGIHLIESEEGHFRCPSFDLREQYRRG